MQRILLPITLVAGSCGPLIYLLTRKTGARQAVR
jgi:hypothetical protein